MPISSLFVYVAVRRGKRAAVSLDLAAAIAVVVAKVVAMASYHKHAFPTKLGDWRRWRHSIRTSVLRSEGAGGDGVILYARLSCKTRGRALSPLCCSSMSVLGWQSARDGQNVAIGGASIAD